MHDDDIKRIAKLITEDINVLNENRCPECSKVLGQTKNWEFCFDCDYKKKKSEKPQKRTQPLDTSVPRKSQCECGGRFVRSHDKKSRVCHKCGEKIVLPQGDLAGRLKPVKSQPESQPKPKKKRRKFGLF